MSTKTAEDYAEDYTRPELREQLKEEIKAGDKGGKPGEWSARKSQLLQHEYEKQGGDYKHKGQKTQAQKSLEEWSDEDWQTADGQVAIRGGKTTRYLPKAAWDKLSAAEKKEANKTKVEGSKEGEQHVEWTDAIERVMKEVKDEEGSGSS